MKRWFVKTLSLSLVALCMLALVPATLAEEDDLGTFFSNGEWLIPCGSIDNGGISAGLAKFDLADRIPPEFYVVETIFIYSAQNGVLADVTQEWTYDEFSVFQGFWIIPVPGDGYSKIVDKVYDSGGGLHSENVATADCTTGEILLNNSSVYGPKVPAGFELRSLVGSSAVLDAPGGKQVGDNAVLAGQSWYVNPVPVVGPDGKNYTEIFVGGYTNGYIPTECIS